MCIPKQEFVKLRLSGDILEDKINALRRMVHRVCKLTNAQDTCPYQNKYGQTDPLTCETCPMKKGD